MGQYKQWLHYRELDRHLHTQLTQRTAELVQLQGQAAQLAETLSLSDNVIVQALLAQFSASSLASPTPATPELKSTPAEPERAQAFVLPELAPEPEDSTNDPDEQGQTAPQRALPWWFRNTPEVDPMLRGNHFSDQQSERTDRLIHRWMERWGRSDTTPEESKQEER